MSSVKKNYLYNSTLQIFMTIVPLITTPYISRVIGAEGNGTYSFYYSIASYYMLFIKLGIDNYGNREVAEHKKNPEELNRVFSELAYLQFSLGVAVCIVYCVYAEWWSQDSKYAFLFFLTVLATVLDVNWFLYGMEEFKVISIRNAAIKIASTAAIFLFVKNEEHIFLYCLILNLSTLICQIISWPLVFKRTRFVKVELKGILKHVKPNMILFMSLISVSIFKTMDKVMLGVMSPTKEEVGFYEYAERIIHIPNILINSLGTVMLPRVSSMIASNDDSYKKGIFTSMVFSMAIASSMSFGLMGISREFVPFFYGPGYDKIVSLYLILLPCCIFMSFATVIRTQHLLPFHRDKDLLIASILGAVFNLVVNWILIPRWGCVGAAVATLASEIIVCAYQVFVSWNELDIKRYLYHSIRFVLLGAVMFAFVYVPDLSFISSPVLQIAVKIILGMAVYIMGCFVIIKREEKKGEEDVLKLIGQVRHILHFRRKA